MSIVATALGLVIFSQAYWPQLLDLKPPVLSFAEFRITHLVPVSKLKAARAGGNAQRTQSAAKRGQGPSASAIPGTKQWRQHADRGHGLDFPIVAEQSLPVLRAYRVPLAMAGQRPRGRALLFDLQTGGLSQGVVADDVVVREVEGLPAEFDSALRNAERELGVRPRVWALYPGDLYAVLRSLTEDALKQQGVSVESVQEARVRLSLTGGRAFTVTLVTHS
jgi:hypothetical protein